MIEELDIKNVYHVRSFDHMFDIYFTLNNTPYSMKVNESDGVFTPWLVFHDEKQFCLLCEDEGWYCDFLKERSLELFHHLIQFPTIRLEWLFIPHE